MPKEIPPRTFGAAYRERLAKEQASQSKSYKKVEEEPEASEESEED